MLDFYKFIILLNLILLTNCSGPRSDDVAPAPNVRNGRTLTSVDPRYVDEYPALSSDATKLVFISGRNGGTMHAFLADRSAKGVTFNKPTQISPSTLLTNESSVRISPNGNHVLLQGATTSGLALVLCFASGTNCSQITTTPWERAAFGFSPDSSLFYYLSGNSSGGATLYVSSVSAPGASYQIGAEDHWTQAFWIPMTSGYKLMGAERSTTNLGTANLVSFTFASAPTAAAGAGSTVLQGIPYASLIDSGPLGAIQRDMYLVARADKPTNDRVMSELGSFSAVTPSKFPLVNQIHTYSTTGADLGLLPNTGFEMLAGFLGTDGDTIFTLNRIAGRCGAETESTFGNAIAFVKRSSATVTWKFLKKPTDMAKAPTLASEFCDKNVGDAVTGLDFGVRYLTVASNSTDTNFNIAWVSDMTGDPEIFAMDTSGGGTPVIWPVSANRKP